MNEFWKINGVMDKCCQLALRQPLPDKRLILMTDASFQAKVYAVLTENDPKPKSFVNTQNLSSRCIRFQNIYSLTNNKIQLRLRILSKVLGIQKFSTYKLGNTKASHHHDR